MILFQENAPHIQISAFQTVAHVWLAGSTQRNLGINFFPVIEIKKINCTIKTVLNVLK
jgi:hypothetical protein